MLGKLYKKTLVWCLKICIFIFSSSVTAENQDNLKEVASKLDAILESNSLRVCVWPEYYSITYLSPRDYTWLGIDIDLAENLAQDLGVNLELIDSSFVTLIDDVLSDKCDIAMFGIGVIEQRQRYLRFTDPHLASDVLAITTKANRKIKEWQDIDQSGNVVSVAKNTIHEPIMAKHLKNATVSIATDFQQREKDVMSGRSDVFITDFPYAVRMLDTTDWARLVSTPETVDMTYYAWALAPGDDIWYEKVQSFVHKIKHDNRLMQAALKYGLESIVALD